LPLGPAFSSEEVVAFLRQLRPTALLGMPSFIMTLVDYIAQLHVNTDDTITISKIITGENNMQYV
jgi:phenylacetate-coenzyme A ligase PaaK-like adenylate-forming protein